MKIEISTQQLNADIARMRDQQEALDEARRKVFACIERINAMWEGQAHNAFVRQVLIDSQQMGELMGSIDNLIECMEHAKSEYDKCSENVKDKIAAIRLSGDY